MAVDKLVDSSQLNTDLTSVANAIRTKGGTSASLAFPSGFVSAIGDISAGGFNPLPYVRSFSMYNGTDLTGDVLLDFAGNTNLNNTDNLIRGLTGVTKLTIKGLDASQINSMTYLVYGCSSLTQIDFVNCTFTAKNMESFLRSASALTTITGEVDFSDATNMNYFFTGSTNVVEFRVKPSTISYNCTSAREVFSKPTAFSDDTIISIANGLNAGAATNTIAFHTNVTARCSSIMGRNDSGTFVKDSSGTLSVADFITNVKGWTLT